jgi:hypothetical protein
MTTEGLALDSQSLEDLVKPLVLPDLAVDYTNHALQRLSEDFSDRSNELLPDHDGAANEISVGRLTLDHASLTLAIDNYDDNYAGERGVGGALPSVTDARPRSHILTIETRLPWEWLGGESRQTISFKATEEHKNGTTVGIGQFPGIKYSASYPVPTRLPILDTFGLHEAAFLRETPNMPASVRFGSQTSINPWETGKAEVFTQGLRILMAIDPDMLAVELLDRETAFQAKAIHAGKVIV